MTTIQNNFDPKYPLLFPMGNDGQLQLDKTIYPELVNTATKVDVVAEVQMPKRDEVAIEATILKRNEPKSAKHIDHSNPLQRLVDDSSILDAAVNVVGQTAGAVVTGVRLAQPIVTPIASASWHVLQGAGNCLLDALSFEEDYAAIEKKQKLQEKLRVLSSQVRELKGQQWEYDCTEFNMIVVPMLTGMLFDRFLGPVAGGFLGYLSVQTCRGRFFSQYQNRKVQIVNIQSEMQRIASRLGRL